MAATLTAFLKRKKKKEEEEERNQTGFRLLKMLKVFRSEESPGLRECVWCGKERRSWLGLSPTL